MDDVSNNRAYLLWRAGNLRGPSNCSDAIIFDNFGVEFGWLAGNESLNLGL